MNDKQKLQACAGYFDLFIMSAGAARKLSNVEDKNLMLDTILRKAQEALNELGLD